MSVFVKHTLPGLSPPTDMHERRRADQRPSLSGESPGPAGGVRVPHEGLLGSEVSPPPSPPDKAANDHTGAPEDQRPYALLSPLRHVESAAVLTTIVAASRPAVAQPWRPPLYSRRTRCSCRPCGRSRRRRQRHGRVASGPLRARRQRPNLRHLHGRAVGPRVRALRAHLRVRAVRASGAEPPPPMPGVPAADHAGDEDPPGWPYG
jgi:hypothetical protein